VWNSQNLNGGGAQAALDFRSWLALAADLVWLKNSNGLKWRGLGFCTGTLFEWASPTQKQRLQSDGWRIIISPMIPQGCGYASSGFQCGVTLLHRIETCHPYQFARDCGSVRGIGIEKGDWLKQSPCDQWLFVRLS
jgi:hypothetical protein